MSNLQDNNMNLSNILYIPRYWASDEPNPFLHASTYFYKAQLLTKLKNTTYQEREEIGQGIIQMGHEYRSRTKNYFLKIFDKVQGHNIDIPLYNRFNEQYIEKQLYTVWHGLYWTHSPQYFLTITLDFYKHDSIKIGHEEISKQWNQTLSNIKKYDKNIQFLKVMEIQTLNTKNVHLHILINSSLSPDKMQSIINNIDIGTEEDLHYLPEEYEKKNGHLPSNRELFEMGGHYILKYVSKEFYEEDTYEGEMNKYILWALRARTISFSRNLKKPHGHPLDEAFKNISNSLFVFSPHLIRKTLSWIAYTWIPEHKRFEFVKIFKYSEPNT